MRPRCQAKTRQPCSSPPRGNCRLRGNPRIREREEAAGREGRAGVTWPWAPEAGGLGPTVRAPGRRLLGQSRRAAGVQLRGCSSRAAAGQAPPRGGSTAPRRERDEPALKGGAQRGLQQGRACRLSSRGAGGGEAGLPDGRPPGLAGAGSHRLTRAGVKLSKHLQASG